MKNHDFPPGRVGGWKELGVSHHRTSMISMHPAALFGCASQSHAFWSQWGFFLICSCGTTTKYCRKKASGRLQGKLVLSSSGIFVHIQRFSATQDQLPRLAQSEFCITRISPRYPRFTSKIASQKCIFTFCLKDVQSPISFISSPKSSL